MATVALSGIITPSNVVTTTSTSTLTNKTLTGAVMNGTLGATTPSTGVFTSVNVSGSGAPLTANSTNSNGNKITLQDNGTVKSFLGTGSFGGVIDCAFQASDSSGNIRFAVASASGTIGLNTQPATSGTGITFPATQSASSNANTLDDYEEGTWTTTFSGLVNLTGTAVLTEATYTKVGRIVTCTARITGLSITSTSVATYLTLTLPFGMIANGSCPTGSTMIICSSNYMSGSVIDATSGNTTEVSPTIPAVNVTASGSIGFWSFTITYESA